MSLTHQDFRASLQVPQTVHSGTMFQLTKLQSSRIVRRGLVVALSNQPVEPLNDCGTKPKVESLTNSYDEPDYSAKQLDCFQVLGRD